GCLTASVFPNHVRQLLAECHLEEVVEQNPHIRVELLHPLCRINVLPFPDHLFCLPMVTLHLRREAVCHRVTQGVETLEHCRHSVVEAANFLNQSEFPEHK